LHCIICSLVLQHVSARLKRGNLHGDLYNVCSICFQLTIKEFSHMIKIDVVIDYGCSTISCNKYSNKLWNLYVASQHMIRTWRWSRKCLRKFFLSRWHNTYQMLGEYYMHCAWIGSKHGGCVSNTVLSRWPIRSGRNMEN
jgi:hypothetical protein